MAVRDNALIIGRTEKEYYCGQCFDYHNSVRTNVTLCINGSTTHICEMIYSDDPWVENTVDEQTINGDGLYEIICDKFNVDKSALQIVDNTYYALLQSYCEENNLVLINKFTYEEGDFGDGGED